MAIEAALVGPQGVASGGPVFARNFNVEWRTVLPLWLRFSSFRREQNLRAAVRGSHAH